MYAYKTNSADYLDYVASVKTRQQILADPDLCPLLENPYIKDNMEIAILWNKAKYGDYQDKYNFLEYLMCNGPELDADTILHYRQKAYNDPVCMEIAYSYLTDVNQLDEIRQEKYKKQSDDCFNKPCFYLGKFSAMMGHVGDAKNTQTPATVLANTLTNIWRSTKYEYQRYKAEKRGENPDDPKVVEPPKYENSSYDLNSEQKIPGSQDTVEPNAPSTQNPSGQNLPPAGMRAAFAQGIEPGLRTGWYMMLNQIITGNDDFSEELMGNLNTAANAKHIGDWMASPVSNMLELVTKANVRRNLGDCGRLWSQVRRLNLFGSDNKYGPIRTDQLVQKINPDGTPQDLMGKTTVSSTQASVALHEAHNVNS